MNERKIGFIKPVITNDHFVLGGMSSLPAQVLRVDGDWTPYLPDFESQLEPTFDSDGCTCYGTLNCIETLERGVTGVKSNYSDRFIYNEVGITPPGSDPHLVATTIRGAGLVDQFELSDEANSLAEFMTPRPNTIDLRVKGQQWLNKHELGHEWLWTSQPNQEEKLRLMKQALLYSPIGISVTAWYKNNDGLYYSPEGQPNEHWTCCYNIDETGIYVFDSYQGNNPSNPQSFLKKLTLDHNIEFAKRYALTIPTPEQNWIIELIKSLFSLIGLYKKKQVIASQADSTVPPVIPSVPPAASTPKYLWDNFANSVHSVRVICDEQGLNLSQKNLICAVIHAESGFKNEAKHVNPSSTDWGICQINDYYHIGVKKDFPTVQYVLDNPDKAVIFMINMYKAGKLVLWEAFKNGSYMKYL